MQALFSLFFKKFGVDAPAFTIVLSVTLTHFPQNAASVAYSYYTGAIKF
jgi:hypothetical protein